MSLEQAKNFMNTLKNDTALQAKLAEATKDYAEEQLGDKAVFDKALAPIAKEAGYDITYEDMAELAKKPSKQELSDDVLEAVAGGIFCIVVGSGNKGFEVTVYCPTKLGWTPAKQCHKAGLGFG